MATTEATKRSVPLPEIINDRLEQVRRRERSLRMRTGFVDVLSLFLVAMLVALLIDWTFTLFSTTVREVLTFTAIGVGAVGLLALVIWPMFQRRSLSDLAAEVDGAVDGLEERWQTVTEISSSTDPRDFTGSPAMFKQVVREAVAREPGIDVDEVVSSDTFKKHGWILAGVVAAHLLLFLVDAPRAWVLARRFFAPTSPISLTQINAVEGNAAVPRGEPLRLQAEVTRRAPEEATLFLRDAQGTVTDITLKAKGESPQFTHALASVDEPFSYRFRAGDAETDWYEVSVHDRPRLTGVQFRIRSPEYTGLAEVVKAELPAKIRAVEGSTLEIEFSVDQPLEKFQLEFGKDERVEIAPDGTDPQHYVFRQTLDKTIRFSPVMTSRHGLENLRIPSCQVVVYADRAPQVTIISPEKEISVRPEDQVVIEMNARDDFGVARAELIAYVGEAPDMENAVILPVEPVEDAAGDPNSAASPSEPTEADPTLPADSTSANETETQQSENTAKVENDATVSQPDASKKTDAPGSTEKADPEDTNEVKSDQTPAEDKASNETANQGNSDTAPPSNAKPNGENSPASNQNNKSTPSPANQSNPQTGNSGNPQFTPNAGAPPRTMVMPIPMADQSGSKNFRGKVKLDISKFQLKHGEQLQYMVRVYDTRNMSSSGQSHAEGSPSKAPQEMLAQENEKPSLASQPSDSNATENGGRPSTDGPMPRDRQDSGNSLGTANATASNNTGETAREGQPGNPQSGTAQAGDSSGQGNPQSDPNNQASSAQNSSSSSPSDSSSNSSPSEPSLGQTTGAPQPENPMNRRKLDVESQSSASSTMRIHIDQWAGSFASQQREKLEVQIDPVLKELDVVLAKALELLKPASQFTREGTPLNDEHRKLVQGAETQIDRGESLVGDLVKKTDGTPYAFIGLQLVDITSLHISPAHGEVKAAITDPAEKQSSHIQQGEFHIERAREMLANLTKTYENVKRNARLVEEFQRIKNMYQVFVEDSLAMLASSKPALNDRDRKIAELELDQEFLDKYTEMQKRWQEILAELAKVLAEDPRLLERYMSLSRRSADTLRDQLTLLHRRQQDLLVPTDQLADPPKDIATALAKKDEKPASDSGKNDAEKAEKNPVPPKRPTAIEIIRATLVKDMAEIAESAAEVQEDLTTWLPRNIDPGDSRVAPLRDQGVKVARLAAQTAGSAAKSDGAETTKLAENLTAELKVFENGLDTLASGDDAQLTAHINRRLARVRGIQQKLEAWNEKQSYVGGSHLNRALEVDQHQLAEETLTFVDKLSNLEAQLAGLPEDILVLGDELRDIIRYDVLVDQMSSELRLRDADLRESRDHQKRAVTGFERAEAQFDKLIDRIIEEEDKIPPEVPDLDNMQLPTLEDLLARLEAEQNLAELLGIPNRPTNLQQLQDWLMRRGGSGAGAAGGSRAMMMQQARQDALRAIRRASQVDDARPNANQTRRWNTLASQLDDVLRQGRGNTPPKQYRQAIERYFELISGAREDNGGAKTEEGARKTEGGG